MHTRWMTWLRAALTAGLLVLLVAFAVGTERERGGEAPSVEDAARGHDRNVGADGVDDLGDEWHRGDGAGVTPGLGALRDHEIASGGDGIDGVTHASTHRSEEHTSELQSH